MKTAADYFSLIFQLELEFEQQNFEGGGGGGGSVTLEILPITNLKQNNAQMLMQNQHTRDIISAQKMLLKYNNKDLRHLW